MAVDWRQGWRPGGWALKTTMETWQLGRGDDNGDLGAGD